MILHTMTSSSGPGMWDIFMPACLWVASMMVVLFHRSGIQVLGITIACIGLLTLLVYGKIVIPCSMLIFGLIVHTCGRLLLHYRRRG